MKFSKKEALARRNELLFGIGKDLLNICTEKAEGLIYDKNAQAVFTETVLNVNGDKATAFESIGDFIKKALETFDEDTAHPENKNILLHPVASRVVKNLIVLDPKSQTDDTGTFSSIFSFSPDFNSIIFFELQSFLLQTL